MNENGISFEGMLDRSVNVICNNFQNEDKIKVRREILKRAKREKRFQMWDGYKTKVLARELKMKHSRLLRQNFNSLAENIYQRQLLVHNMISLSMHMMFDSANKAGR
jgi:hypothetical protein